MSTLGAPAEPDATASAEKLMARIIWEAAGLGAEELRAVLAAVRAARAVGAARVARAQLDTIDATEREDAAQ